MDDAQSEKRLKRKSNKCFFPGCSGQAINSHTISKENSLRSIARAGEVFCFNPIIKDQAHILEPKCVGIGDASTFRGYCRKHDELFQGIDFGIFKTEYDIALQIFRCIGRWLFLESEREKQFNKHQQILLNQEKGIFEALGIYQDYGDIKSYNSGIEEVVTMYEDLAYMIQDDSQVYKQHKIDDRASIKLGKWTVLYKHLDYQIPLALSSRHALRMGRDIFSIIWTVVPQKDATDIMIMLDAEGINKHIGRDVVEEGWELRINSPILMLETVEATMVSTECWYMNPDVYESLSSEKKENLRYDVKFKCMSSYVWEAVGYTIFEDIWEKMILLETDPKIIRAAKAKMDIVPQIPTEEEWNESERELAQMLFNIYHTWS